MASGTRRGHVYGDSLVDGRANLHQGDQYVSHVEINYGADTAHNYGSITNHFYNHESVRPSIVTPYRRNCDFVHRNEFNLVWQRRNVPDNRVALVGLGGIGKSQIAIEFTYRIRQERPDVWVFWVHASSSARFEESYRTIAESLQLPGRHEPKADVLVLVRTWMSQEQHGSWVMVVDNADDEGLVFGRDSEDSENVNMNTSQSLCQYLPFSPHGMILVTTRSLGVAQGLVEDGTSIIRLGPMDEETAVHLLKKKLNEATIQGMTNELTTLVQQLDYVPLAIAQAAAHIRQRTPRMSLTKYLQDLRAGDERRRKLLEAAMHDPWRDATASNSIIKTWHHSFKYIQQNRESAGRLLSLMCLFDRESISENLLVGQYAKAGKVPHDEEDNFEDDLTMLRNFDLINVQAAGNAFDMHPLVQFSTRTWLDLTGESENWKSRVIDILHTKFPNPEYENWSICQALLPHVQAMMSFQAEDGQKRQSWATVLYRGSWYAESWGKYDVAELMARRSLETLQMTCGETAVLTLISLNNLGAILRIRGKYAEAEAIHRQDLNLSETVLGKDHPDTLTSLSSLGSALKAQGKYTEAEVMHRRALAGRDQMLGSDHPHTLASMSNLGIVLQAQGKYIEAEEMHRRALGRREQILGGDHPYTLTSMNCLGGVLRAQRKYGEAEEMHRRALARREQILGTHHPDTLASLNDLSVALEAQEEYNEAEVMHRRALAGREQILGADHPHSLTSMSNLGSVLQAQGKHSEAEEMYRRALAGREHILGGYHLDTLATMNILGKVLQAQEKHSEAQEIYRRALARRERTTQMPLPQGTNIDFNIHQHITKANLRGVDHDEEQFH